MDLRYTNDQEVWAMADKYFDKAKGRVREAAGALTGDKKMKNKGRADQAKGSVKSVVDKVASALGGRTKKR